VGGGARAFACAHARAWSSCPGEIWS